ncbi:MAG: hypothetical protein PWP31_933 [Clostridia bacterium]|nr:hypothetical protein [Clostridia bacterium]
MKMSELEIPPADEKIKIQKKKAEREEGVIYQTYHRRKDGSTFPVEVNCQGGVKVGDELILLKIIRDITERKLMEERLNYFALHDTITNLYNRTYFEQKMQSLEEEQASTVGIILCDLDGLKLVNDTMGHNTGDKLLQNAAKVIKKSFRENDVVARIGGDEFAILLPDCNEEDVEKACLRIKDSIEKYNEMNPELPLSLSVGFAVRDKTSMKMSELFKEADNNMYQEKLLNTKSSRSTIIKTFKEMLKTRDFIIEGHAERLQNLVHEIGKSLGLNGPKINIMMLLAEFHDIGKIGIPENILLKKAALTSQERKTLQRHCEIGHRIAMAVPKLTSVADLILKHHEWWNGKGYPFGLKGKEIPLECRILAILDAYDAMTNDRPYRKAMTINEAIAELKRYSGIQFDPEIVDKFIKLL